MSAETTIQTIPLQIQDDDSLEDHARALAKANQIQLGLRAGKSLLARFAENGNLLNAIYREFLRAVQSRQGVPPAAEWLLDNFYIVEQQFHQARQDLSPAYYYELPKLASGLYAGFPRTYSIALELCALSNHRISDDVLVRFLRAYQQVAPLLMGEVWVIPIMLRIALIENLRHLMEITQAEMALQRAANARAEDLLTACRDPVNEIPAALKRLEQDESVQDPTYLVQLILRLRDQDPEIAPALHWLEAQMSQKGVTLEDLIRTLNHQRAALKLSTGNLITSLRLLASLDWHAFFESVSLVEHVLSEDPSGTYAEMDFATRDRYRHVIEKLAKHNPDAEVEIARHAIEHAANNLSSEQNGQARALPLDFERRRHVGYFLIDEGLPQLEAEVGYHPPLRECAARWIFQHAAFVYLGSILLLTLLLVAGAVLYAASVGAGPGMLLGVALLTIIPLSVLAVGVVNWTCSVEIEPNPPPKLELKNGIPAAHRTMVVIPALIVNELGLKFLMEHLELRYLANRDENLHFALLGDFADAPQEHMPEDDALIEFARDSIRELNKKYERTDAFFFFHRRRLWNASESVWMGWERKRGKLEEFNALLRGAETSYIVQEGDASILAQVKYVITLDVDTELPMQVARRLVGTLAHPLNRPVLDPTTRIVTYGYGIIQPRVDIVAPAAKRSRFARMFAGDTGLDPYASVVSDVYQDLFHRAVYIGKAIYDVDAMLGALRGRFPNNLLLSHDLLEGAFVRVGLASDIELLEDFPSGFDTYAQRQHRWVRGDWQITDWIFPRVRDAQGNRNNNPLPMIERWKIFDNLRRSLISFAVLLLLVAGWTILPGSAVVWTLLALFCILFPFFRSTLTALGVHPVGESPSGYLWAVAQEVASSAQRGVVIIIFLLYLTTINLDAIGRAIIRRTITHQRLLEWTSHAVSERGHARPLGEYIARMWFASALSIGIALLVALVAPQSLMLAAPLLILWFLAPTIAYSISQPIKIVSKALPENARAELRATARRIWRFYEDLAGAPDHWLPPDNYQIEPQTMIAHRTSPTNIGFLLLSILAAYDFGYMERTEFAERVERVFNTLDQLKRSRGHFYNWYNTTTLEPLYPLYISTVDSGNLAASLIALKQACLEMIDAPRASSRVWDGLNDTLTILQDTLKQVSDKNSKPLAAEIERLEHDLALASKTTDDPRASLAQFEARVLYLARLSKRIAPTVPSADEIRAWCDALVRQVKRAQTPDDASLTRRLQALAQCAEMYAAEMEFKFLYDAVRGVFAVGYNVTNRQRDDSYYDLLASEARLTSFLTIARGEIPEKHWFRLGRPLTRVGGRAALLSWGGTMFEYLMPPLLLRDFAPSLLQQTELAAIQEQIKYASGRKRPWGISESGFYAFDYQFNYQYRAFGVPELGLKRELVKPHVVAPYATFLALPYAPNAAWKNLNVLAELGGAGGYGFFEALDFTSEHLSKGQDVAIVRSYMAHHQGMSLVAIDNFFYQNAMQKRFHREPIIGAAELLLQERVPRHAPLLQVYKEEKPLMRLPESTLGITDRTFSTPHTFTPRAHLLTNGAYSVMITNAGGGYSVWSDGKGGAENFVTRWRRDATFDALGTFCYIRDVETGRVWSNTYQPVCAPSEFYRVAFAGERVEFLRRDTGIETKTEIFVSPENNVEIRKLTFTNFNSEAHTLDLTSYAEVVLDSLRADAAQPAFSKLFVESEFVSESGALLFQRRPRSVDEPERWAVHFLCSDTPELRVREYETDRAKFIGRGGNLKDPASFYEPLSNTVGATLDPVMSLRTRVRLAPNVPISLGFVTGVANSREAALELCEKFLDTGDLDKALDAARVREQVELRHLGITPADATLFQRFASRVLFPDPHVRAPTDVIERNTRGQEALWAYGISGDYPIVLVCVERLDTLNLAQQTLRAHEFWRRRNLRVDLVFIDEQLTLYTAETFDSISNVVAESLSGPLLNQPGGIYVRRRDLFAPQDYLLLETLARVILRAEVGDLADQLNLSARNVPAIGSRARHRPLSATESQNNASAEETRAPLFHNGVGGFSKDAKEYVITLKGGEWTPMPWTNVIANPGFGCLVTDAGLGMTWAGNSQQNRLTPWSNDPITDPPSEIIYLQDIDANEVWSATPLPIREAEPYTIRHGSGYSVFEHTSHELAQELGVFVTHDDPVKIVQLSLKNLAARTRRVRVTYYVDWVLGDVREETQHYIVTEYDADMKALLARNTYLGARMAFAAVVQPLFAATASRAEFFGRNGTYSLPVALTANAKRLSEQAGANLDPCAALQVEIELASEQETEIVFLLGQGENRTHARALIQKYQAESVAPELQRVTNRWDEWLETIQVSTPDAAMDILLNRWLLYQTLACRLWGRAAFYQAGGAYGFRDQLQDVMALVSAAPELAREHLLRSAAHQFPEGDVMHWWHEVLRGTYAPTDVPPEQLARGVRTRISDDYLWLPYVTEYYIRATGDTQILDEQIPYVELPRLQAEQDEIYGTAHMTTETSSLYDHCLRALDHGLRFGAHGLPLMGTGDWNDGMNRVGAQGKGESVWLGWFLYANLMTFAPLCEARGDAASAMRYRMQAERLQQALEEAAWDGAWYRRAYFDDGTPLGSHENAECKIDAIAQAWAVISDAAPRERQTQALDSVEQYLVREKEKMILLLTPAFVHSNPNPGYIQGYVAGIRENGGQYTHGVLWIVLAHALMGNGDKAHRLFEMLNPLNHTRTPEEQKLYHVEPYVVAADVYSHPQHLGRGGWTWYTGSAGWMYRIGIEHLLGLQRRGNSFVIEPCIPKEWSQYEIKIQHGKTRFEITVENPEGMSRGVQLIELDGKLLETQSVPLLDDERTHRVRVVLGNRAGG